jgi:hypothetical protein
MAHFLKVSLARKALALGVFLGLMGNGIAPAAATGPTVRSAGIKMPVGTVTQKQPNYKPAPIAQQPGTVAKPASPPAAPDFAVSIDLNRVESTTPDFEVVTFKVVVKNLGAKATDPTVLPYLTVRLGAEPLAISGTQPMPGPFAAGEQRTFEISKRFGVFTNDKIATCALKSLEAAIGFEPDAGTSVEHPMDPIRSNDRASKKVIPLQ